MKTIKRSTNNQVNSIDEGDIVNATTDSLHRNI